MKCVRIFSVLCLIILLAEGSVYAQDSFRDELAENGIEIGFVLTNIYQRNVNGGLSTNSGRGEISGSYDLEMTADLERLLGIEGSLFLHGEGGWTDSEGIDIQTVGSAFGVNADAIGNRSLDIVELFYETSLTDGLTLTIGKIDFTGYFDASEYANDEATQFINGALVNNPAIPFPDYSLGIIATYNLSDDSYLMGGVADAQADGRETGFKTTFSGEDYFFYIAEMGMGSEWDSSNGALPGMYRVGVWYDPQPKGYSDATKEYRDDMGAYVSCDQKITNENNDPEDTQGLGGFFRYGFAPQRTNDVTCFYSFGIQYQGIFDGRDDDALGLGYAQGSFSNGANETYTADYESITELYYSIQATDWMAVSPSVQYVTNAGGNDLVSDAIVLGIRAQIVF